MRSAADTIIALALVLWFLGKLFHRWRYPEPRQKYAGTASMFDIPFETGDLILSSITPWIASFTNTNVEHTGLIYKHPRSGQLFQWHVLANSQPPILVLEPLYKSLRNTKRCFWRKLERRGRGLPEISPETFLENPDSFDWLLFMDCVARLTGPWGAAASARPNLAQINPQQGFSCVQFCIFIWVRLGVLPKSMLHEKTKFFPEDFSSQAAAANMLPFKRGFSLAPEIKILTT